MRFRIAGGAFDGVSETDAIELAPGGVGPAYPKSPFVAEDGAAASATRNFRDTRREEIRRARN